jgi:hypothetical protein
MRLLSRDCAQCPPGDAEGEKLIDKDYCKITTPFFMTMTQALRRAV